MSKVTEEELILRSQYPRVTYVDVQQHIKEYSFEHRDLLTLCHMKLTNGYEITGESACAVPGNWKKDVGERLALENATNKVWGLLGFELKTNVALVQNLIDELDCPAPGYKSYVTQEAVWAHPMTRGAYNEYRGWTLPDDEDPEDDGFIIRRDGHNTWMPAEVFESKFKQIDLFGEGSIGGPTWEDRLEEEIAQNKARVEKLLAFMDNPIFKAMEQSQRDLMKQQLDLMQALHGVLTARVIG